MTDLIKKQYLSHLKCLVAFALSEASISQKEAEVIMTIKNRIGLSDEDLNLCIKHPETIDDIIPESQSTKIEFFKDWVKLIISEEKTDSYDQSFCPVIALKLGLDKQVAELIFKETITEET